MSAVGSGSCRAPSAQGVPTLPGAPGRTRLWWALTPYTAHLGKAYSIALAWMSLGARPSRQVATHVTNTPSRLYPSWVGWVGVGAFGVGGVGGWMGREPGGCATRGPPSPAATGMSPAIDAKPHLRIVRPRAPKAPAIRGRTQHTRLSECQATTHPPVRNRATRAARCCTASSSPGSPPARCTGSRTR